MGISYNTSIVTDGLVFALDAANPRCYSGSGLTVNGLVSGIGGTLVNGVGFTSSNYGSFIFDGNDDYIILNTQPINSSAFTLIAYVKFSSFTTHNSAARRLVAIDGTGYTGNTFSLYISGTGQIGYILGNGTSNIEDFSNNVNMPVLALNIWYHVCITFDGTRKKLYIGENLYATNTSSALFSNPSDNKLLIGSYNGIVGCLRGNISQVHVYNRALSQQEIIQNYNATKGRYI